MTANSNNAYLPVCKHSLEESHLINEVWEQVNHLKSVYSFKFHEDGRYLLCTLTNLSIELWDFYSIPTIVARVHPSKDIFDNRSKEEAIYSKCCCLSKTRNLICCVYGPSLSSSIQFDRSSHDLLIWDLNTSEIILTMRLPFPVTSIAFLDNENILCLAVGGSGSFLLLDRISSKFIDLNVYSELVVNSDKNETIFIPVASETEIEYIIEYWGREYAKLDGLPSISSIDILVQSCSEDNGVSAYVIEYIRSSSDINSGEYYFTQIFFNNILDSGAKSTSETLKANNVFSRLHMKQLSVIFSQTLTPQNIVNCLLCSQLQLIIIASDLGQIILLNSALEILSTHTISQITQFQSKLLFLDTYYGTSVASSDTSCHDLNIVLGCKFSVENYNHRLYFWRYKNHDTQEDSFNVTEFKSHDVDMLDNDDDDNVDLPLTSIDDEEDSNMDSVIDDEEDDLEAESDVNWVILPKLGFSYIRCHPLKPFFVGLDRYGNVSMLRQQVISSFPGPQYPAGFDLIQKVSTYYEAEDELDKNPKIVPIMDKSSLNNLHGSITIGANSLNTMSRCIPFIFPDVSPILQLLEERKSILKNLGNNNSNLSTKLNEGLNNNDNDIETNSVILTRGYTIDDFLPIPRKIKSNEYKRMVSDSKKNGLSILEMTKDVNLLNLRYSQLQQEAIEAMKKQEEVIQKRLQAKLEKAESKKQKVSIDVVNDSTLTESEIPTLSHTLTESEPPHTLAESKLLESSHILSEFELPMSRQPPTESEVPTLSHTHTESEPSHALTESEPSHALTESELPVSSQTLSEFELAVVNQGDQVTRALEESLNDTDIVDSKDLNDSNDNNELIETLLSLDADVITVNT